MNTTTQSDVKKNHVSDRHGSFAMEANKSLYSLQLAICGLLYGFASFVVIRDVEFFVNSVWIVSMTGFIFIFMMIFFKRYKIKQEQNQKSFAYSRSKLHIIADVSAACGLMACLSLLIFIMNNEEVIFSNDWRVTRVFYVLAAHLLPIGFAYWALNLIANEERLADLKR